jgi:Uma2 family endonuclease
MATSTALTVKDFQALELPEDRRYELVNGEVVEMPRAKFRHEKVKANGIKILVGYLVQNPIGELYAETTFEFTEIDARQPDLAVLLNEQVRALAADEFPHGAPVLVVEVISSESASDFLNKVELYLKCSCRAVWALHSEQRAVWIFTPGGSARVLHGDEPVEADFLPGFSVPASRFFDGL